MRSTRFWPSNKYHHPSIHLESEIPKQVMVDIGLGHLAALASILATLVQKMSVKLPDCFWTVLVSVHSCCFNQNDNMQHFVSTKFVQNMFKKSKSNMKYEHIPKKRCQICRLVKQIRIQECDLFVVSNCWC